MTAERDALVLKMLRQTHTVSDDDATLEQKRQDAIAEARERLTGAAARQRFDGALAYAELVYPQRDDNVPYTEGLPCGLIRRALLAIGSRITERGALHAAGDVSFLHKKELEPALNSKLDGETAAERASLRRAEQAWVLAHLSKRARGTQWLALKMFSFLSNVPPSSEASGACRLGVLCVAVQARPDEADRGGHP